MHNDTIRSTTMELMNENLARAQMSARLGEAHELRRGQVLVHEFHGGAPDRVVVHVSWSLLRGAVLRSERSGEEDEAATLSWSTAVEDGRRRRYCETCSREHLRSMEGKLAPEHW